MTLRSKRPAAPRHAVPGTPVDSNVGPGYVRRTLRAIEYLATASDATPDELARELGVHRRTVARLMEVLVASGWVESNSRMGGWYRLTPRLLTLAGDVLQRVDLVQTAGPFVRELRGRLDESAHLAIPADGFAIQVVDAVGPHALTIRSHLGERIPLHCSAVGKVLASYLPDQLDLSLKNGLASYTPNTITSREQLLVELQATRVRGYAIDDQERYLDTRCVAAPVRDVFGQVVAALGVSGPTARLPDRDLDRIARTVVAEAAGLSASLGYREPEAQRSR